MIKITEFDLQQRFQFERWNKCIMLGNYSPPGWPFECDLLQLTPDGYTREIEIKLQRHDLHVDQEKELVMDGKMRLKHDLLAQGYTKGPNEFCYLLPEALADDLEIPDYAGIYAFTDAGYGHIAKRIEIECVQRPKRLHGACVDPEVREHMMRVMYWRYHRLLWGRHRHHRKKLDDEGDY